MTQRIGVDLGGTKIEGVVLGDGMQIVERQRRATPVADGYEAIVAAIADLVQDLRGRTGAGPRVGIGTPGSVSRLTGGLKNSNTTCLNGRPLLQDLSRELSSEVRLANDANCFALSEAIDGAGEGHRVVFGVILGTVVGGGVVVDGAIIDGPNGITGEWGHNVLDPQGPECYCGKRGCVETFLSGPGLAADYVRRGGAEGTDPPAVLSRAARGEDVAAAALDAYMERLGQGLATVINILDPDCIVLGGGLSCADPIVDGAAAAISRHTFNDEMRTAIVRNRHGDSSGVRGAALLW